MRLDRYLSKTLRASNKQVKHWLEQGAVTVDGSICSRGDLSVSRFSRIVANGHPLPCDTRHCFLMNKPAGVLSATRDAEHTTAIELLARQYPALALDDLHLAGRLDRATTGLLLLTNDGLWSKRLTRPEQKIPKTYLVTTAHPIDPNAAEQFALGVRFDKEGVTTAPAQLQRLADNQARLTIYEGMHHQIKRMFALYRNPVVALHRERMGHIVLEPGLAEGQARPLSQQEIQGALT
ncbi:pseudouridine synthase [Ferrimonas sediminicola]|uniref:Pseudouridine synthase n=1 Tax=Ferrimonas sediminicola TaxID=2569538 RepID=A0A4U1BCG5_9GAMM|nr:16S rRNA pseudouridine(516) synthase [Ferrimonas sediminicola]TKB48377.1 pseudouridine synthase [Ferrimonas sediminicola]